MTHSSCCPIAACLLEVLLSAEVYFLAPALQFACFMCVVKSSGWVSDAVAALASTPSQVGCICTCNCQALQAKVFPTNTCLLQASQSTTGGWFRDPYVVHNTQQLLVQSVLHPKQHQYTVTSIWRGIVSALCNSVDMRQQTMRTTLCLFSQNSQGAAAMRISRAGQPCSMMRCRFDSSFDS